MEFEDILSEVGGYGKYQKRFTLFFLIPMACIVPWNTMGSLFMVSIPEHWCSVPNVAASNFSIARQRSLVSPPEDPSCSVYDIRYPHDLDENFTIPNGTGIKPCSTGWQYDTINYDITAASRWNLVCEYSYFPSLILAVSKGGSFVMSPIYGFLADRYGRKTVYLLLAAISCVGELTSALMSNLVGFTILRIILGTTFPSLFTIPFILMLELVAPETRAHMNGVFNVFWTFGLSSLPLVAYLTRSYAKLGFACSAAGAGILLYCRFIPESPCWLISRGKYDEATKILERIGKENGKPQDRLYLLQKLQVLGEEIKRKKEQEKCNLLNFFVKNQRIRRHFLILAILWSAFNVTYFGPLFNLRNLAGNEFMNFFLLCIVEVPGNILFWVLMDRVGRRWTCSIGFLTLAVIFLGPLSGLQYSDIVCSMVGKFISTGLFMVVDQQGMELFPTVARSFSMTLGKTLANVLCLWIPFFADLGEYGKELPFLIMSCISFIAGFLASVLPETLNENLPQTISDAEKFGRDQKFFSWNSKRSPIISEKMAASKPEIEPLSGNVEKNAAASKRKLEDSDMLKMVDKSIVENSGDSSLADAHEVSPMLQSSCLYI